jgi:cyclic dehypoxanthinyl futalosine synthase
MGISKEQALEMLRSDDLLGIGREADAVRKRLHPSDVVTYQIDRNVNYTNFCTEYCTFCAFYRPMGSPEGYIQPLDSIFEKIDETLALGGTGVLMQGGLHPDLKIEYYEELLSSIKRRYPRLHLHCFSAPEILNIAEVSGLTLRDTIARLMSAGLDSIPGGGAEILDDEVRRRIARLKCTTEEWLAVHRTAHALGLRTTATMMFGCGETFEHRVNHFEHIRRLQEETGGFTAFIPWVFQRANTSLGNFIKEEATAVDYLKSLVVDAGIQDLPDRVALRRQRCGQHSDRGERRARRGRDAHHQRRATPPSHSRRGFPSCETRHTLPYLLSKLNSVTGRF